jgi:phosphatidylinositol-3-phosphatase
MKAVVCVVAVCALLAAPAASAPPRVAQLAHVVVVVFENKEAGKVLGSRSAPTFNAYSRRYVNMTRYYGVTHPSLPNYLALVSGSTQGITSDCTDCIVDAANLADSLENAGRSWKTYAEGLPSPGFTGAGSGRYAKKHNPFLYFRSVAADPARRARVVPLPELSADLLAGTLPDFALVVPDLCHSMHDCSVSAGDAWLRRIAPPLLQLKRSVVFVLFDEGSTKVGGGGHVAALALGTAVRRGVKTRALTSHYSVLRTIEESWRLPLLGHSAHVPPITAIWR